MVPAAANRNDRQHDAGKDQRTPAQRDRDRILYSSAFRRLGGVTQVVGPREGRIFHNRLTHSLKVAQIARRLAEKLRATRPDEFWKEHGGLDPDVAEAAALAHDLGHPPFGHVAEKELALLVRKHAGDEPSSEDDSSPSAVTERGDGFEGNAQSFRVVTRLSAHRPSYRGLDLTRATLNGVLKYPWLASAADARTADKYGAYQDDGGAFVFARAGSPDRVPSLEAQVLEHADNMTYSVHALEDFVRAGLIPGNLGVMHEAAEKLVADWKEDLRSTRRDPRLLSALNRYDIGGFASILSQVIGAEPYVGNFQQRADLRYQTSRILGRFLRSISVRLVQGRPRLIMRKAQRVEMKLLQRVVWVHVIENPRLGTQQEGERRIVRTLFEAYLSAIEENRGNLLPEAFTAELEDLRDLDGRDKGRAQVRLAADIVSSFSDHEALTLFLRLSGVSPGSVLDLLHA